MWWRNFSRWYLLWLLCITSQIFHLGLCRLGESLENESFIKFVRAIDPTNVLANRWNGLIVETCSDQWACVKCDLKTRRINEIRFENLNLSGVLDTDSLCKLPSLQVLNLAKNRIVGTIPWSILNCKSLTHLNLSHNLLEGELRILSELKNLKSINVSKNRVNYFTSKKIGLPSYKLEKEDPNVEDDKASISPQPSGNEDPKLVSFVKSWYVVIICLGSVSLFVFIANKRAPQPVTKKDVLQFLEDSSIKISPAKAGEEIKQGEEHPELVFFVEEHERFRIEDLLESAADLQGQSLCSSLYKVRLRNNAIYAVKRLKKLEVPFEQFRNTMKQIGSLRHDNILSLIAYYCSKEEKLLIYRYQRNGSLLALLEEYGEGKRDFPWSLRLTIAHGIAKALNFIHQRPCSGESIPHSNLKLSNILLTEYEDPLISEYGFQRFLDPKKTSLYSSNGYRAPEKHSTEQGDVFSFGIILLSLLTGKTVERSGIDLPKWVKSMVREEWTGEVFDKEVNRAGKQWAFPLLNVALKCVSHKPEQRPSISEVLDKIEEAMNDQEEFSFSSPSSVESNQDGFMLQAIPETSETPGSII